MLSAHARTCANTLQRRDAFHRRRATAPLVLDAARDPLDYQKQPGALREHNVTQVAGIRVPPLAVIRAAPVSRRGLILEIEAKDVPVQERVAQLLR